MLKFIKENRKSIKVFVFLFILGLASGVLCFKYINLASNNTFIESFNETLDLAKEGDLQNVNVFANGIKNTIKLYLILILTSLIVIAPLVLFVLHFIKGFSIGILMSVLLNILGFNNGLIGIIFLITLPNLLCIPAYIFLSIKTIDFNYFILDKSDFKVKVKQIIVYLMYFVLATPIIILSIITERLMFDLVLNICK